jgi:hypothetical protein
MGLRENLVVTILFLALLAQGMFAAAHCFEAVTPPSAAQLAFASSHDNDCDSHIQPLTSQIAQHDSVKAVPVILAFGERMSQTAPASRKAAPDWSASALFSPPLALNSILRI